MSDSYKIVFEGGTDEIVEKKSRFIATVQPVDSEEEALAFIQKIKKEHWNARHNCYAYVIGKHQELQRFSDDGEPGGTAGKPMLEVLLMEDVHNVAVVVTRYFGGILLGAGGLVRAYTKATTEGLRASKIVEKQLGMQLQLHTDYTDVGKVQYILGQRGIAVIDRQFTESVLLEVMTPMEEMQALMEDLTEGTNGRIGIEEKDQGYYAEIDGEVLVF